MPTNILRSRGTKISTKTAPAKSPRSRKPARTRQVEIKIGKVAFVASLLDTPAAERIWRALPLYSTAETWGASIHFEIPVESGREQGATATAEQGGLYYWSHEHRVILAFGHTPLSRDGEMRLPAPCAPWAKTDADLSNLTKVTPGQKVSLTRHEPR